MKSKKIRITVVAKQCLTSEMKAAASNSSWEEKPSCKSLIKAHKVQRKQCPSSRISKVFHTVNCMKDDIWDTHGPIETKFAESTPLTSQLSCMEQSQGMSIWKISLRMKMNVDSSMLLLFPSFRETYSIR